MTALVLIGPPGAGKTTVGRALATRLGFGFLDTDSMVEERAGATVAEIFVESGEATFRELEKAAVAEALDRSRREDLVVALGGGAPMDPTVAERLRDGPTVIFLDVSAGLAAKRVGLNASRPLLQGSPRKVWRELMERRRPVYSELGTMRLQVDGLTLAEAAETIAVSVTAKEG
jgi:shikimate kinase